MKRGRRAVSSGGILDAACRVFSEKGYFLATVDDVASIARVGKGTVYRHFRDKEGLLLATLDRVGRDLDLKIAASIQGQKGLEACLTCAARETLSFFSSRPAFLRIIIREGALSMPSVRRTMRILVQKSTTRLALLLGGRSKFQEAEIFNSMVFGLLRRKLGFADEKIRPEKEANLLVSIFLNGFRGLRK